MKSQRWRNPEITMETLALKLCEEAAEVGTAFSDLAIDLLEDEGEEERLDENEILLYHYHQATRELQHVEFIARTLHDRLAAEIHELSKRI